MSLPVLTAVTGAVWEATLVAELDRFDHGVTVVRRCVDLTELISAAAAGIARAALLSADLRRLDRDAIARLGAAGVAVVGLTDAGDEPAERRLRLLGVAQVLAAEAGAGAVAAAVHDAVARLTSEPGRRAVGDPRGALPDLGPGAAHSARDPDGARPGGAVLDRGRVVAVWGPTGAPGRTMVAVGLADEASRLGIPTLLVDGDIYGGVVAQVLGLLDEAAGLAAACRLATNGELDRVSLAKVAWQVHPTLRVLTGVTRPDRWPELRPSAVELVLEQARALAPLTVVDCGFCLERDEEIAFDTMAPRRNAATVALLTSSDIVLCVGSADPVALNRMVRAVGELRSVVPGVEPLVIVNRVRPVVVPGEPRREIAAALARYASVSDIVFLPEDRAGLDRALGLGKTLAEASPGSPIRRELAALARRLMGVPPEATRRWVRRSRPRGS